jgi:hypothetical protein
LAELVKDIVGYKGKTSLREGLAKTYKDFLENPLNNYQSLERTLTILTILLREVKT